MADSDGQMPNAAQDNLPLRCVTIDVEEYFHIESAYGVIARCAWNDWPSRVEASVDVLLGLFAEHHVRGTFFVLGDVAGRCPQLVRRIAAAGHEIASHGSNHDHLRRLNAESFRDDVLAGKQLLEDQTGAAVIGYRAPNFSITTERPWAIDTLIDLGFEYDASIFPVRHPAYGVPHAPRQPFHVRGNSQRTLLEIPPLTWHTLGRNVPVAGGGYFRLLPLWLMRRGLTQATRENRPAVLYFHPWEFDAHIPKMPLKLTSRIRTYTGLASSQGKLEEIISQQADWRSIADGLAVFRQQAAGHAVFHLAAA